MRYEKWRKVLVELQGKRDNGNIQLWVAQPRRFGWSGGSVLGKLGWGRAVVRQWVSCIGSVQARAAERQGGAACRLSKSADTANSANESQGEWLDANGWTGRKRRQVRKRNRAWRGPRRYLMWAGPPWGSQISNAEKSHFR